MGSQKMTNTVFLPGFCTIFGVENFRRAENGPNSSLQRAISCYEWRPLQVSQTASNSKQCLFIAIQIDSSMPGRKTKGRRHQLVNLYVLYQNNIYI